MSEAAPPLSGFHGATATWRLLLLQRRSSASLVEFQEHWRIDADPASMLPALEFHDQPGHCVRIRPDELKGLTRPALLQLKDDRWLLLRGYSGGRLVVEGEQGVERVRAALLIPHLSGMAIELLPRLPGGETLGARFKRLLLLHRRALVNILMASVPLQLLALVTPELSGLVLGQALPDGAASLLRLVTMCVVLAALFTGAVAWFRERAVLHLVTTLEVAIKRGFLDHVLRLPFPLLQGRTLGELLQSFSAITAARTLFAERAFGAMFDGVLAIGYLVAMGTKLWAPTLTMLLATIVMALLAWAAGHAQAHQQAREVDAQARQLGYLTEMIAGVRTIKAAGAEGVCHTRWLNYFGAELDFTLRRQRIGLWPQLGMEAMHRGFSVTMLIWGGYSVLQGSLGLGELFAFLLLSEAFLRAITSMVDAGLMLLILRPQLVHTSALFATPPLPRQAPAGVRARTGQLVMNDVWFRYGADAPWILRHHELLVEPGSTLSLHGPSGYGKSTILRLLAGLYQPDRGSISLGDRSLSDVRQRVLYLPQFVQLYAGSIMENLQILSGGASPKRLVEAAAMTRFDVVIDSLAMKLHTPVPRGGANLSGGQRQLLALTAVLASDRDVLLLDEPMANLDSIGAACITDLLQDQAKTVVLAGHATKHSQAQSPVPA